MERWTRIGFRVAASFAEAAHRLGTVGAGITSLRLDNWD